MASRPTISADQAGIIVTVTADTGNFRRDAERAQRASSGLNEIARHRPTRYALMMRRARANESRKLRRVGLLPAILPGDCPDCAGLGVVGSERERCGVCHGSGER